MALDFPASPSVGQKFPSSPIVGIPSYTWDGEKWTTAVGTASGGLAVLYDKAQSLTALNQQQARQNIYAAPFDAMAYSGLQINGGMEVSQEKGAGNTAIGSGPAIYVMDGWYMSISTPGGVVVTGSQAAGYFAGFPKSLNLAVTTAQASIAATDLVLCQQLIEGYRIARLAWGTAQAQPLTISFWSAHHRPGIYSLVVRNPGGTRCYPVTYTQAVADVAQYNTVTIPGCTDGAWTADNTAGIMLLFTLACGSTYTSASNNNWLTTNTLAALGQINAVAATSDVFRLTGVIVLPGSEAPSAARSPFVMRPFTDELERCQRYYWKTFPYTQPPVQNVGSFSQNIFSDYAYAVAAGVVGNVVFPRRMRAVPTIVTYAPDALNSNWSAGVAASLRTASEWGFSLLGAGGAVAAGTAYSIHATADARL